MTSTKLIVFTATIAIALVAPRTTSNTSAAAKPEDNFSIVKVGEGVYAAIAKPGGLASGNAGFVVGDNAVLVFDTFFTPQAIEDLLTVIESETKMPVKFAVNSHYHLDHTGGNQVLAARGIPIIAHDRLIEWQTTKNRRFLPAAEELQKRKADLTQRLSETPADKAEQRTQLERQLRRLDAMMGIKLTNPTVTFSGGVTRLYVGQREVMLFSLGGHTGGDVLAYVPDANVVFTGDMGWRKTLPNLVDATVNEWVPSLDKLLSDYPNARFIPGHGEVASAEEMREFRDYLADLRSRVQQAMAEHLTVDQAKERLKLPEKYKGFAFQNFATPNVEDMFKELSGTKQ
ncbi:MAG TPA: MBL fold metallo-hydrolase [Pyrinomonadaceae bacterium]|nr:MBL fold metallo-hydrolase [Pyrinomonadaceae bacterium]